MPPTTKRVLILLAPGAEEMETVIPADVLRRAGAQVVLAGVKGPDPVTCSRQVRIVPDAALSEVEGTFDVILCPGGKEGAKTLQDSKAVQDLLRRQHGEGRICAAICAGPLALISAGVGRGAPITSHPGVRDALAAFGDYRDAPVVVADTVVTSQGPGTAFDFALALVAELYGPEKAREVAKPMVFAPPSPWA